MLWRLSFRSVLFLPHKRVGVISIEPNVGHIKSFPARYFSRVMLHQMYRVILSCFIELSFYLVILKDEPLSDSKKGIVFKLMLSSNQNKKQHSSNHTII